MYLLSPLSIRRHTRSLLACMLKGSQRRSARPSVLAQSAEVMELRLLQTTFTATPASFPNQDISDAFPHLRLDNATGFAASSLNGPVYSAVSSTQQSVSVFSPNSGAGGQTARPWMNPTSSLRATFDTGVSDFHWSSGDGLGTGWGSAILILPKIESWIVLSRFPLRERGLNPYIATMPTSNMCSRREPAYLRWNSIRCPTRSIRPPPPPPSDDHGNTPSTATLISVPSTTAGNLEVVGDNDYFKFNAVGGRSYQFTASLGTLQDSTLTLYG